jgi:hypothetical protein
MDAAAEKLQLAWQPLTPRGVAAFAHGSWRRLLAVQLVFALLAAATTVWSLRHTWLPVCEQAIRQLPTQGEIRFGRLDWRGDSPMRLAESPWLTFSVDLAHAGQTRSPAHMQVEFGQKDVRIYSLFGFLQENYPPGWRLAFNRAELEPWWGAWVPELLVGTAAAVLAGLPVVWAMLATVYSLPVWLIGFFANRNLNWSGSWRLAGAALMPGAMFLTAAVFGYSVGLLDLVQLAAAAGLHLLLGWVYLVVSPLALPRHPGAAAANKNPFVRVASGALPSAGQSAQPRTKDGDTKNGGS